MSHSGETLYAYLLASTASASPTRAAKKRIAYVVGKARYNQNARGQIIGEQDGFLKLLFRRDDMKLIGVHVIGEQASELVHTGLCAMLMEASADLFIQTCFNYPTLSEMYKYATYDALGKRSKG